MSKSFSRVYIAPARSMTNTVDAAAASAIARKRPRCGPHSS